ncbi:50S ribosomal protein L3 [Aeropyrum pernix]|uniref:Large ribosomal subunit protein uL3 n=1 Tax=Aeropyrum pernix TaxID=56636 RepID=A0A401HBB2_AERPX|nr:50S ribosomal protein L3 [Aeropyrum pernix]
MPRVKSWPEVDIGKPVPLAFLGYRAGMTHVFMVDDRPGRPTSGKEIFVPVTIVETPPMFVAAVRLYGYDPNRGRYSLGEAWAQPPPELELQRRISTLGSFDTDKMLKSLEERLDKAVDVRLIAASQPKLAGGLSKKKPDLLEIKVGGVSDVTKLFDYAKDVLGNLIAVNDVFEEGQLVDVIAVTKGKGFQGVIKRWGVKELPRWHKHRKGSRRIGARSHGRSTFWETPQAGQTGFHRRTEYNKRILMIDDDGYKVTPAGGFLRYGVVRSTFVMLSGSIPGTPKRPIVMRWAIRPPEWYLKLGVRKPEITYISLASKQGV